MTVDVACVGAPFLDLIFRGLPALPVAGEEQLAQEVVVVPGAMANVAYALRRLGLDAVVCAPVGADPAGRLLHSLMADAGVPWVGGESTTTPVSVALPVDGDRAFVTACPEIPVETGILADLEPRSIVTDLPNVDLLPEGPAVYAVVGDPEVRQLAGHLPEHMAGRVRALIANEREACALARNSDVEDAARYLATGGCTVVVTCAEAGALTATPDGRVLRVSAPACQVDDPTGAGDLFTAALVWADHDDRALVDQLRLATTYASLSLAARSCRQKGLALDEFQRELMRRT